jgi:hypothetical protein
MLEHRRQRLVDVAGLGDDLESGLAVEQHAQALADDRVVVGEHKRGSIVPRGGHARGELSRVRQVTTS